MRKRGLTERLLKRAVRARVELDPKVAERLAAYVALLLRWNVRMNLTALGDSDRDLDRLVIEPLVAARHLPLRGRLVDIGSGGGSPAIPLQVVHPCLDVRMVESKMKKGAFLRDVIRQLGLTRSIVENCRYEELLTRPELHESQDAVTIRAVRVEARVLRNLQALVRPGGMLALFRGSGTVDPPRDLQPPLLWEATYPLVETLRSRLVLLRKLKIN